jgi:hypothetical protein
VFRLQAKWHFPGPRDPRMLRWCQLMARHVARLIVWYDDLFFEWLRGQVLMIEDYAYAGLDFCGDPDLALPEDAQWGDLSRKYTDFYLLNVFVFLTYSSVFVFIVLPKY